MEENSSGKALDNTKAVAKSHGELKNQGWPYGKVKEAFCCHCPTSLEGTAGHRKESFQRKVTTWGEQKDRSKPRHCGYEPLLEHRSLSLQQCWPQLREQSAESRLWALGLLPEAGAVARWELPSRVPAVAAPHSQIGTTAHLPLGHQSRHSSLPTPVPGLAPPLPRQPSWPEPLAGSGVKAQIHHCWD